MFGKCGCLWLIVSRVGFKRRTDYTRSTADQIWGGGTCVERTPTNFLDSFDEFGQAMMQSRPSLLSQSFAELLLSLIPERKSPAQAIRAELRKHDIPRAAVYALYLNQALLLDSG